MSINLMAVSALPQETKSFSAKIARMRRYNKKKIDMVFHIKVAYTSYGYNSGLQKTSRPIVQKSVVSIRSGFDTSRFDTNSSSEITQKFRSLQV